MCRRVREGHAGRAPGRHRRSKRRRLPPCRGGAECVPLADDWEDAPRRDQGEHNFNHIINPLKFFSHIDDHRSIDENVMCVMSYEDKSVQAVSPRLVYIPLYFILVPCISSQLLKSIRYLNIAYRFSLRSGQSWRDLRRDGRHMSINWPRNKTSCRGCRA